VSEPILLDNGERLCDVALEMWNLIEKIWLGQGIDDAEYQEELRTEAREFSHRIASHWLWFAAGGEDHSEEDGCEPRMHDEGARLTDDEVGDCFAQVFTCLADTHCTYGTCFSTEVVVLDVQMNKDEVIRVPLCPDHAVGFFRLAAERLALT
jgi:hypothetical protein